MNLRLPPLLSDLLAALALVGLAFVGASLLSKQTETNPTKPNALLIAKSSQSTKT
ncbi:hypothetical protein [Inhella proteolytica]|uniref:Uncharacterized protein n=1 Tax=Inhella proteolytica TaxID=2795029 RepID=A0A931J3H9_9BURK|nr:hypothetical protein [Inhella proteolytica]MBH9578093.1 hypothetical protein [Inhella proteolytica]